ncbi:ABC transporter ATP-binding protein [Luxibacter massiliensis]|uniref:ABC transporter ATP-binding protein n=1 Tax=Luxibacter massiliensis TaxID=2219695 RepID=UPI000F059528|nr:ABC transporter ATP-binding protein [Luxibacter massiliensis]
MQSNSEQAGLSYLFALAGKHKKSLIIAIICSVFSGLCSFIPYLMVFRTMMFLFSENGNMDIVMGYGLWSVVAIVLRFIFQTLSMTLTHVGAYSTLYEVRKRLCNHMGEINLGFYTDNSSGEVKKVLTEDVERLEKFLSHQIPDIVVAIVVPLTVLMYLFTVNMWMSFVLIIPILLTFLGQFLMLYLSKKPMETFYGLAGQQSAVIMQFINGMPIMKTYNLTADSFKNYAVTVEKYEKAWWDVAKWASPMSAVMNVLIESGLFFTLPLGGYLYLKGNLELSSYIFFVIMSIVFLSSYSNLMNFAQIFSQISSGVDRIKEILDIPSMKDNGKKLKQDSDHKILFEHVSFSYGEQEVLHDINLTLPQGTLTAFVGASGAGKSTAAQLIPRFWDVTKGCIKIGDIDIREIKNHSLMDHVSFVFQDAFMLEDTMYENIAVGKTGCSKEEVMKAAKAAQIHDFIMGLPAGYETHIGSEGVKLSGGERQRICIARAILKDAPIIIFDEATSFTDIENEHKIQVALENLLKGKTTIMIAHRLHTIIYANKICVFDDGYMVESGKHDELIAIQGLYEKMWDTYTQNEMGVKKVCLK